MKENIVEEVTSKMISTCGSIIYACLEAAEITPAPVARPPLAADRTKKPDSAPVKETSFPQAVRFAVMGRKNKPKKQSSK